MRCILYGIALAMVAGCKDRLIDSPAVAEPTPLTGTNEQRLLVIDSSGGVETSPTEKTDTSWQNVNGGYTYDPTSGTAVGRGIYRIPH